LCIWGEAGSVEAEGYAGLHRGHSYGSRNQEGEMLVEFFVAMSLIAANTGFQ